MPPRSLSCSPAPVQYCCCVNDALFGLLTECDEDGVEEADSSWGCACGDGCADVPAGEGDRVLNGDDPVEALEKIWAG